MTAELLHMMHTTVHYLSAESLLQLCGTLKANRYVLLLLILGCWGKLEHKARIGSRSCLWWKVAMMTENCQTGLMGLLSSTELQASTHLSPAQSAGRL